MPADALAELKRVVVRSGLVRSGSHGVVLVSGGPDSACAAAALSQICAPGGLTALHLNYGLREDSDADEQTCRHLCGNLRIDLEVKRPELPAGNVQAAAREARYAAAEELRRRSGGEFVATGHTRSDVAETVIYRLASSPGRRALLGMPAKRGSLIRPLLSFDRAATRRLAIAAALPFRDDPSNEDPGYARNRIRAEVLPVLRELSDAAEANIAETRAELAEEADVLDRLVASVLEEAGAGGDATVVMVAGLTGLQPGLRRLALRTLAERAAGEQVALGRRRINEIWRLATRPEGGTLELGGGLHAVCEAGTIRFETAASQPAAPQAARLTVPGSCRFGRWRLGAELDSPEAVQPPTGPEVAALDAHSLGDELVVRAWQDGDRMRPLGLDGTKTLQDLFTDNRVPRSLRHTLPVVIAKGQVAWVAGVAVSEEFKLRRDSRQAALISARLGD
ncbi:MAG: tRNA(Ile)-lysidine synthase [Solirubrobacterales bacterium]|nr:tRNA(Ile)-lysidine synthase [Solirubrobacterales bacterium]